ncbi:MAG: GNAT family N-acetyltransferase, partial [Chloroflexota bacterium]
LGSVEISDFLDVIVSPENHRAFLEAVLEFLISPDGPDWDCLDLYNLLDDSPTLPVLEELAADFSLRFFQEQIQPSPYIPLPNDFDDYLNGLDKKYRHEMKRKMRNAAKYPIPISWNYIEDETELEQAFNDFGELMREDKEKNTFLTPPMVAQMWAIVQAAFQAGYLRLGFLNVGKERAVGMLNFDYANRIWVYNSGMSAKHESVSPGILLTSHMMLEAIENGREAFDMMRGSEDYKYHMGGIDRFVIRASVMR